MGCHAARVKRRREEFGGILLRTLVGALLGSGAGCGGKSAPEADGRLVELRREQWHQRVCLDFWMLAADDPSGTRATETSEYWYRLARVEKRILDAGGDPRALVESPMQESGMPIRWQADCAQMRLRVKQQVSEIEDAEHIQRWSGRFDQAASERLARLRSVRLDLEKFLPKCGCTAGSEDASNVARLRERADELDRQTERNAMDDNVQRGIPERGTSPTGR